MEFELTGPAKAALERLAELRGSTEAEAVNALILERSVKAPSSPAILSGHAGDPDLLSLKARVDALEVANREWKAWGEKIDRRPYIPEEAFTALRKQVMGLAVRCSTEDDPPAYLDGLFARLEALEEQARSWEERISRLDAPYSRTVPDIAEEYNPFEDEAL